MYQSNNAKPIVFVAPLDWGLGHATRCIPIINELLKIGCDVIIASEGKQAHLLKLEFPEANHILLKGYRLSFGKNRQKTVWKLFFQIPKILTAIKQENRWLKAFVKNNKVDIVISDNRYGLYHPNIKSIFITHQLLIKTPFNKLIDKWLQQVNYRFISRFHECWVPDTENGDGLAGELSHPTTLPGIPTSYLGALSRVNGGATTNRSIKLLVMLSGPEPQRTLLEKQLYEQLKNLNHSSTIVRGLPDNQEKLNNKDGRIQLYNHLPIIELQSLINNAEIIISRPGYSTIMDLLPIGKKCIFIPTPGQSEQEYLGSYLAAKGWCCEGKQGNFNLAQLLNETEKLNLPNLSHFKNENHLRKVIGSTINSL
jgi:predicted glycosyltransferase